ncbi:hypothetical protein LX64_01458 [Chitinophaga skermanii]|uniref:Uncharacterized protein n=1 Tax=Chitinophaga skermanii TaxID=331697 RepID=A0A327QYL7_9BACT|nr:hypothetical protein [Chitinophaga skermanii]RAJ08804.1 hypothetical protein LX64_01458 [Chitinophaga skermanii]
MSIAIINELLKPTFKNGFIETTLTKGLSQLHILKEKGFKHVYNGGTWTDLQESLGLK